MKISACFLNWRRPQNLRANLRSVLEHPRVDEAIVWNNNPDAPFEFDGATVINSSRDCGLHTRFASAALARHQAILIFDDDVGLPHETIDALFDHWQADYRIIHGIFGRRLGPGNRYQGGNVTGQVPIVLTRALMFWRSYAPAWLSAAMKFQRLFRDGAPPYGNGEDILLSYVARRVSGRLNRAYDLPYRELPAGPKGVAIHSRGWAAHVKHRTHLCQTLEQWLADDSFNGKPKATAYRNTGTADEPQWETLGKFPFTPPAAGNPGGSLRPTPATLTDKATP